MEKLLISACLIGKNCKYSGGSNALQEEQHSSDETGDNRCNTPAADKQRGERNHQQNESKVREGKGKVCDEQTAGQE